MGHLEQLPYVQQTSVESLLPRERQKNNHYKVLYSSMKTVCAFLFGFYAALTGGCNGMKRFMPMYAPNRPYYFAGADLKNYPVSVYSPIGLDKLTSFTNTYYEACFDEHGHIVVLRKLLHDVEVWKATYRYYESGAVKEERWSNAEMETVRFFSADGKQIHESRENSANDGTSPNSH